MTFTFSDNHEVDYSALGMCPVCGVRFTHGCKHSNTLEAQEWLAAYAAAESSRENTDYYIAVMKDTAPHPVNEMQDIEREIDGDWLEREQEHADWLDEKRTQEDAR